MDFDKEAEMGIFDIFTSKKLKEARQEEKSLMKDNCLSIYNWMVETINEMELQESLVNFIELILFSMFIVDMAYFNAKKGSFRARNQSYKFRNEMNIHYVNDVYNRRMKKSIQTNKEDLDNLRLFFNRHYLNRFNEYTELYKSGKKIIEITEHGSFEMELVEAFANNYFWHSSVSETDRQAFIMSVGITVVSSWPKSFLYKYFKQFSFLGEVGI